MHFILVIALFYQIGSFLTFVTHGQTECILENGRKGVCKPISLCHSKLKQVQDGKRRWESPERCGFQNFTEIVCCAQDIAAKIQLRPADMACNEYRGNSRNRRCTVCPVFIGIASLQGQYPYAVALGYKNTDTDEDAPPILYNCGGSLISYDHVLTSAHCVRNTNGDVPVEVRLGDRDLNGTNAISIPISHFIVHPKYKLSEDYYDVAIIKLPIKLNVTKYIKPVCLETKSLSYTDLQTKFPVAIGWGLTSYESDRGSNRLLRTPNLRIVNNDECAKHYQYSPKLPFGFDNSLICAMDKVPKNRSDTCQGDSGGPLLSESKVLGITTSGAGCGFDSPGIYTAVYPFLDWIEQQVWPKLKEV